MRTKMRQQDGLMLSSHMGWCIVFVSLVLLAMVWVSGGPGRSIERACFVFPNGDVFKPSELSDLTGAYYIKEFADEHTRASGDTTIRLRVTVLLTYVETEQSPFSRRTTYRFLGDSHYNEEWEVIIEDFQVKDIRPPVGNSVEIDDK